MHRYLPPPAVVALLALGMWLLNKAFASARLAALTQHGVAAVLLGAALLLMGAAVYTMFRARTTVNPLRPERASQLVTTGVFGWSRNPIYVGDALALLALAFWFGNALGFLLVPLFVLYMNRFQIKPEEDALAARFGAHFRDYCARVRRWV